MCNCPLNHRSNYVYLLAVAQGKLPTGPRRNSATGECSLATGRIITVSLLCVLGRVDPPAACRLDDPLTAHCIMATVSTRGLPSACSSGGAYSLLMLHCRLLLLGPATGGVNWLYEALCSHPLISAGRSQVLPDCNCVNYAEPHINE